MHIRNDQVANEIHLVRMWTKMMKYPYNGWLFLTLKKAAEEQTKSRKKQTQITSFLLEKKKNYLCAFVGCFFLSLCRRRIKAITSRSSDPYQAATEILTATRFSHISFRLWKGMHILNVSSRYDYDYFSRSDVQIA